MVQAVNNLVREVGNLKVDDARQRILADCRPVEGYQQITLREGLHRVLAESVRSPINVPAHTNSAVDGYAVQYDDIPARGTQHLKLIGTAFAGTPFNGELQRGQAVRIMTGAVIPDSADCVIMQEQVQVHQGEIEIGSHHRQGENVRQAGEDLTAGEIALAAGIRLRPADQGLLASLGINEIRVRRRLRVGFFSTGDELCTLGQPLHTGQIYDSNRYTLLGLLQELDLEAVDLGIVPDQPERLRQTLLAAAAETDAIITSGGVSVGEADYLREMMQSLGQMHFWQIAMKPGRPLAYGRIAGTPMFGLPGNPVAVMVTFYQFVQPALLKLSGVSEIQSLRSYRVRSASDFRKKPGRTEFQRALLYYDEQGELMVRSFGKQGSGILRSMSEANCLVVLPEQSENIRSGDWVDVQPFDGLQA